MKYMDYFHLYDMIQISFSIVLGAILGPLFFFISPEWSILYGGFIAGTFAFFIGELNVK